MNDTHNSQGLVEYEFLWGQTIIIIQQTEIVQKDRNTPTDNRTEHIPIQMIIHLWNGQIVSSGKYYKANSYRIKSYNFKADKWQQSKSLCESEIGTSRKTMHWTLSAGTLSHLLFCALVVAVNFVCALIASGDNADIKADYNHFESKYFGENETYNNDKRLIIEDFYRQSALAAKSIHEMSFRLNRSGIVQKFEPDDDATMSRNLSTPTTSHFNEGNKN